VTWHYRSWHVLILWYNIQLSDHIFTLPAKEWGSAIFLSFLRINHSFYWECTNYSLRKLTVAFNTYIRIIFRRRLFDRISDVWLNSGWRGLFDAWIIMIVAPMFRRFKMIRYDLLELQSWQPKYLKPYLLLK
jgi:hypothetical protein